MKKFDQHNEMMPDHLVKPQAAPEIVSDGEEEHLSELHGKPGQDHKYEV